MTHSVALPYDSEMLKAHEVLLRLRDLHQNERMNPQDFVDRAIEEYAKIGFVVDVKTYSTGKIVGYHPITREEILEEMPGLWSFDIEIQGRVDRHEFDHDRMSHEVRNNLLELPDYAGPVKDDRKDLDAIVRKHAKGHQH